MAAEDPTAEFTTICGEVDPTYTYKCGHDLFHDGDHSWEPGQELGVSILMPKPPVMEALDGSEGGTVEIGGQVMTQAQYDAARFPLIDKEPSDDAWEGLLYQLEHLVGFRLNEEEETHLKVLLAALQKYHERDQTHRGLWRYFGAIDSAFQSRAKATRTYNNAIYLLRNGKTEGHDPIDDAIDMINYGVFFLRSVDEGNFGG